MISSLGMQVYTGAYCSKKSTTRRVISECDICGLEIGHLVALHTDGSSNKPLIGKCIAILDDEIKVGWLNGSYATTWHPSRRQDPNNPQKTIDWTGVVPKSSIILYDFALTSSGHLRKAIIQHLKHAYSTLL